MMQKGAYIAPTFLIRRGTHLLEYCEDNEGNDAEDDNHLEDFVHLI